MDTRKIKDFCFLWYINDWLGGTDLFTREQKGAYHDLLMTQANNGHLSERQIKIKLDQEDGHFKKYWQDNDDIKSKFTVDGEGKFFNAKLEAEILKRKKFCDSRKNNLKTAPNHMDDKERIKHSMKSKGKKTTKKIQYSDHVKLTEKQYNNIRDNHLNGSEKLMKLAIEKLDAYIASKGDKYVSHDGAIRSWVVKQVMDEHSGQKGAYL